MEELKPGIELDTLIAEKVMGLSVCKCDHNDLRQKAYDAYVERCKDPMAYHGSPEYFSHGSDRRCNYCNKLYIPMVNYSTDIANAWDVVEKMRKHNPFWGHSDCMCLDISPTSGGGWHVNFGDDTTRAYADLAPHAICLAALKASNKKPQRGS